MMIEGIFWGGGGFLFFLCKLSGPMYRNSPSLNLCETKVTLPLLCHLGQAAGKEGLSRDLEKIGSNHSVPECLRYCGCM